MGETKIICIKNISDNCQCPQCKREKMEKERTKTTTYTMNDLFPEHSSELTDKES